MTADSARTTTEPTEPALTAADLSTLATAIVPLARVPGDERPETLDAMFQACPDTLGVELVGPAGSLGVLPRAVIDRRMTRDWFRAAHGATTLAQLHEVWREPVLTLPADAPICEAASRALDRTPPYTYDPVLVTDRAGTPLGMLDVRALLEQQTRLLRTALRQVAEERDAADRATRSKSEFLANMSHEIRTPMTAILGFADLLLDPALREAERASHVRTIQRNGDHLLAVLNDILDLSKIESGKLDLETVLVDLGQLVEDVASLMRVRAHGKGLPLHVDHLGETPARVECDPVRLRQVLMNLLGNAVKFTEAGFVALQVAWRPDPSPQSGGLDGHLAFTVRDTGIGIDPTRIEAIFEPFAQADTSSQRRFGGSGLGLAISRRLAEMMGGDLEVDSNPGRGSRFTLRIPVRSAPARPTDAQDDVLERVLRKRAARCLEGRRVLLAEDGVDNQRLISHILQKAGMHVTIAANGRTAVEHALEAGRGDRPFDVVLMDMQMPELDGYGATRELRQNGFEAPVIALTAHAMSGDRERCLSAGCDEFETKPVRRDSLLDCIARVTAARAAD